MKISINAGTFSDGRKYVQGYHKPSGVGLIDSTLEGLIQQYKDAFNTKTVTVK